MPRNHWAWDQPHDQPPTYTRIVQRQPIIELSAAHGTACLELPVAALSVAMDSASEQFLLIRSALEPGVLFGRYERCLIQFTPRLLTRSALSRVHLLLLAQGNALGTWSATTPGEATAGRRGSARLVFGSAGRLPCQATPHTLYTPGRAIVPTQR